MPVLEGWIADGITSLREITQDDVTAAVDARQGHSARYVRVALRSLFRALRQERVIFRDPTHGVVVAAVRTLPESVPSDVLAGLLDHARGAAGRFILALVAVHALPGHEIRHLLTADLDLAKGRLTVRRGLRRHTIYLEGLTHRLASEWLSERHRRWPGSTNPHLPVSQQSAMDAEHRPVHITMLKRTCDTTAMRYISAAHPEKTARDVR